MIPDWLYETSGANGLWVFVLLTVVLGGAAAFVTGKAIAETWRPLLVLPFYIGLLTLAVRFLHFALFEEPLLAPGNLAVDGILLLAAGFLGHRMARARTMVRQYDWLYAPAGLLGWRRHDGSVNPQTGRDSE